MKVMKMNNCPCPTCITYAICKNKYCACTELGKIILGIDFSHMCPEFSQYLKTKLTDMPDQTSIGKNIKIILREVFSTEKVNEDAR